MTDNTDHDLLIRIDGKVSSICRSMEKLNGRMEKAEDDIGDLKIQQTEHNTILGVLEKYRPPNLVKLLAIFTSIVAALMALATYAKG